MKKRIIILLSFILILFNSALAQEKQTLVKSSPVRGVWVSVFSVKNLLYSKEGVNNLIAQCKKAKITQIYLQIFQSGNAYYDSKICNRTK